MLENVTSHSKKCILVVDDEQELVEILEFFLIDAGFETVNANNGAEALRQFNHHEIDMVISDVHMPVMNGLAMYEQIRHINQKVPVLFISGYSDLTDERAKNIGALALFNKPIDTENLMKTVIQSLAN